MDPIGTTYHNDTHDPAPTCYVCPPPVQTTIPVQTDTKPTSFDYRTVVVSTATVFGLALATALGAAALYYTAIFISEYWQEIIAGFAGFIFLLMLAAIVHGNAEDAKKRKTNTNTNQNDTSSYKDINYFLKEYKHVKTQTNEHWQMPYDNASTNNMWSHNTPTPTVDKS